MKLLMILLSIAFIEKGCNESEINQDNISLEYISSSRGSYKQIIINKKVVSSIQKRGVTAITKTCTSKDWGNITNTLKAIDVENIPNLEAPSKKFLFDGAAIARLKISYGGDTYETKPFDHGNPPKDIVNLIEEILSISENIE